jgi:hypothetical protein
VRRGVILDGFFVPAAAIFALYSGTRRGSCRRISYEQLYAFRETYTRDLILEQ